MTNTAHLSGQRHLDNFILTRKFLSTHRDLKMILLGMLIKLKTHYRQYLFLKTILAKKTEFITQTKFTFNYYLSLSIQVKQEFARFDQAFNDYFKV